MKKVNFQALLPVTILREGDQFVAYAPALELSTSGNTFEQAQNRFTEAVQLFLEECFSMGTLDKVLTDLGWKKEKRQWNPPVVVAQDTYMVNMPCVA